MTRKQPRLSALALIAVIGVIGACGSGALAGTGNGGSARDTNAVDHANATEVTTTRGLDARGSARVPSGAAPSPTGTLPSRADSSLPATRRTRAGVPSAASAAGLLPGRAVGAARSAAGSLSAPSSTGALPPSAASPVRSTSGTAAGPTSSGAPARALPDES